MNTRILSAIAATAIAAFTTAAYADDHLATAVSAGGLIEGVSQPYQIDNPGKGGEEAPGQGSPLSGHDHQTPASLTAEEAGHALKDNPAFLSGKTAPSQNSNH